MTTAGAAEALREAGNAEFRSGDYLKAAATYTRALKADPSCAVLYRCARRGSGSVCKLQCCSRQGAAARQRAVTWQEDRGLAAGCLSLAGAAPLRHRPPPAEIANLTRATPRPLLLNHPRPCSNRALALLKLNKLAKALTDAEQCTKLDPSNVKGWYRQAQVLETQGHIEQVRARGRRSTAQSCHHLAAQHNTAQGSTAQSIAVARPRQCWAARRQPLHADASLDVHSRAGLQPHAEHR